MKLHEYQAKDLLAHFGTPVPGGEVTSDPVVARDTAQRLGGHVVVKAQVHMGGRGKAGGVKLVNTAAEAEEAAREIIGKRLISAQNPTGIVAEKVLVAAQVDIAREYYLAITLDRASQRTVIMLSAMGGMDIEQVAHDNPAAIVKIPVDPAWGLMDFEIRAAVKRSGISPKVTNQMVGIVKALYKAYLAADASLIEINPLAETPDGKLIAADAKVTIDENAMFRQKEYAVLQDESAEDPIEAEAHRRDIAYVRLGGDIGVIGNGAGLVMCTLDEVSKAGGKPANFLDIGGGAGAEKVKQSVDLVLSDPNVKGILFNIFGGITRGDLVAQGILDAFAEMDVTTPVVIRLEGTNSAEGRALLRGTPLVPAETMQEAARQIVAAVR